MKIGCFGDVVGRPGREALSSALRRLRAEYRLDFVIVNGENAAGGIGIDGKTADEIRAAGADVVTLGDHTFHKKDLSAAIQERADWLIRPANYPAGAPGRGFAVVVLPTGIKIGVANVLGRVFMNSPLDCPFQVLDALIARELSGACVIVVDVHAEATSEKAALARYVDGRVSLVFGTHTHVQTADERLLPRGTAFMTDLGMCGASDGVIGMDGEVALKRFLTGLPHAYVVAEGDSRIRGMWCEVDDSTGKASAVGRIDYSVAT